MRVTLAKTAGFCAGVKRAVDIAEREAAKGNCVILGELIHNNHVLERLAQLGADTVSSASEVAPGQRVVIRSHGATAGQLAELEAAGAEIVDATCPAVARIHRIVEEDSRAGMQIVIIGKAGHPEVEAAASRCAGALIFSEPEEIEKYASRHPGFSKVGVSVVAQTTASVEKCEQCVNILNLICTSVKFCDTICSATVSRQREAKELSRKCNGMIVIGARHSANSRELYEICRSQCPATVFIESAAELDLSAIAGCDHVGITAGASVPAFIIKEVYQQMSNEIMTEEKIMNPETESAVAEEPVAAANEVESFEELLERSIRTLHTGEKVVGVVTRIGNTEVEVDVGVKQAAFIPLSELTDDPSLKPEDVVKIGDSIETYVMRVNDVEGTISLSKKRVDSSKVWDTINEAKDSRAVLEGVVTEENKGGVVVSLKGVRVFVPASQSGLPKDAPLTPLVGTKVKLRVIEVNQSRRRVVGSIRQASSEERRAKAEAIWNEIEIGKTYAGVVKSLTSYGAFVDIGGIDGMVHVSELSWKRIKQPSDVVSVGDQVEVYVIGFDKEKKKISLGYRKDEDNPWAKFVSTYAVDSVAQVKIVKLMDFGAFAEILPGVDGLIHISQIADHRIGKPGEVLNVGDVVDAKIIGIDDEKKKVSLSIRALLAPEAAPAADEDDDVVYDTDDQADAE